MPRILSAPKNPEILGRVITAFRLLADERPPSNARERGLLEKLRAREVKPAVAKRMLGTLNALPRTRRTRFLGPIADPAFVPSETAAEVPVGNLAITFPASNLGGAVGRLDGLLSVDPDFTPLPMYTIRYIGMFCQSETNGPGSDEIYIITSAVHIDATSENVVTPAVKHPLAHPGNTYGDVDREEERLGPVGAVWVGNGDPVSLVVVLMEHDEGDPDAYRDEIEMVVKASIAVISYYYPAAAVLSLLKDTIVDAVNWLFDTDDDLISTETVVLSRASLEAFAGQSPGYHMGTRRQPILSGGRLVGFNNLPLTTGLFQHFTTKHRGDGSEYVVGFDIVRDPPLPRNDVIL